MPSSVVTPVRQVEPAESSFVVGCLLGLTLGAALVLPVCVLLLKL